MTGGGHVLNFIELTGQEIRTVVTLAIEHGGAGYHHDWGYPGVAAKQMASVTVQKILGHNNDSLPDRHAFFRVEDGDGTAGYLWLGPYQGKETSAAVYHLEVVPGRRRQGIGGELLKFAEAWAVQQSYHDIVLHVFGSSIPARQLYDDAGFSPSSIYLRKTIGVVPEVGDEGTGHHDLLGTTPALIAPVFGSPAIVGRDLRRAAASGADIAEIRLDLSTGWDEIAPLAERSPLPVLATIRSADEGGEFAGDYREAIRQIAAWQVAGIDVEINRPHSAELIAECSRAGRQVVASFHDFGATPSTRDMEQVLERMVSAGADIAKLATMPGADEDVERQRELGRRFADLPLINIAMGARASWTRLVPASFGSVATFASLARGSAPGQIPIAVVRAAIDQAGSVD